MTEYRIEYTISSSEDGFNGQETEVGFGSSGTWGSIEDCLHMVESDVQNGLWETPTTTGQGDCPCGYRAGSRPTQIGCGAEQCPFRAKAPR